MEVSKMVFQGKNFAILSTNKNVATKYEKQQI